MSDCVHIPFSLIIFSLVAFHSTVPPDDFQEAPFCCPRPLPFIWPKIARNGLQDILVESKYYKNFTSYFKESALTDCAMRN